MRHITPAQPPTETSGEPKKDAFIKDTMGTAVFSGNAAGSEPSQTIFGQLFQGSPGLTAEPAISLSTVDALPEGNVTLLKMERGGFPAAELATEPINTGVPVILLAFAIDPGTTAYTARSKVARISGRSGTHVPASYLLDGDLGSASHGGMIVDSGGRVVGVINADFAARDDANRLISSPEHVRSLLAGVGVDNSRSATDHAYRAGIDDYFGGRYSEAIRKLDTVIAVMPDHSIAHTYRKQAADRLIIEGDAQADGPVLPIWAVVLLVGLAVALLVSVVAIIWLIVQRRHQPVDPFATYVPVSGMPVSAQPTSAAPMPGTGNHPSAAYQQQSYEQFSPPSSAADDDADPWAPPRR